MSQTIDNIKQEILSKLNLQAEFESFGIKLIGKPSPKGWIKCPSPFNPDKLPSCGVCIDNSSSFAGYLRVFNNSGPRQAIGFFDLAKELSPTCGGKEFIEILKYYAEKTGVECDLKTKNKSSKPKGKIVATYDYKNLSGELSYQVCRLKPKSFRQRRPDPHTPDAWLWNMEGISALPYHIRNVTDNQTVYIVEGEKCADDLINKFSLPATTFHGGAGKWYPEVLQYFNGKNLILLPDNDIPGKEHMQRLAHAFKNTAKSVKIVELPELQLKYDISDWIAAGNTKDQLLDLCKKTLEVEEIEDPIDELNKRHAVVTIGGKVRILDEKINIKGIHNIIFLSKYDFNTKYENRTIPNPLAGKKGQPKKIQLSKAWMGSPKRREYEEVVFEPQLNNDNSYNLYQGLAFSPIKGDWSKYRNHLRNNICNGDMQHYDWLFAWMARIVQKPGGKKPGTAIVLQGERGVGKGVFAEIFGKIFGNHFQLITNSKQATGRFNSALKNCILLYLDEAFYAGDKTADGVLKGLITSDQHNIELKGKDTFQMSNHVNCIIASNNDWAISAGSNERRYFVLKVAQSHMQDHKYFKAIDDQMYNKKGIAAMLYDLLELDISKYNLREAPKTVGLSEQVSLNFKSFRKFWFELLCGDFDFENIDGIISTKLYDMYINHCDKINERYKYTDAVFGKKLTHYSHARKEKKRLSDGQRPAFYFFNDRNSERKKFEEITKTEFNWENDKIGIDEI